MVDGSVHSNSDIAMAESPEVSTGSYYVRIVIYILTWDLTLTAHRHDHRHQYLVYSLLDTFFPVVCDCD